MRDGCAITCIMFLSMREGPRTNEPCYEADLKTLNGITQANTKDAGWNIVGRNCERRPLTNSMHFPHQQHASLHAFPQLGSPLHHRCVTVQGAQ